jgi:hypothetical protein
MASNRPARTIRHAQKLNEDNIGTHLIVSHRNFVKAAKDPKNSKNTSSQALSSLSPNAEPSTQGSVTDSVATDSVRESDECRTKSAEPQASESPGNNNNNDSESQASEYQSNKKKKNTRGMSTSPSFLLFI